MSAPYTDLDNKPGAASNPVEPSFTSLAALNNNNDNNNTREDRFQPVDITVNDDATNIENTVVSSKTKRLLHREEDFYTIDRLEDQCEAVPLKLYAPWYLPAFALSLFGIILVIISFFLYTYDTTVSNRTTVYIDTQVAEAVCNGGCDNANATFISKLIDGLTFYGLYTTVFDTKVLEAWKDVTASSAARDVKCTYTSSDATYVVNVTYPSKDNIRLTSSISCDASSASGDVPSVRYSGGFIEWTGTYKQGSLYYIFPSLDNKKESFSEGPDDFFYFPFREFSSIITATQAMLFILFILTALFLVFALIVRNCCLVNKKRKNLVCCVGFCGRDTPLCTLSFPQNFLGACIGFLVLSVIINIFLNLAGLSGTGNQEYYRSDLSLTSKLTGSWIALFVVLLFITQIAPLALLCIGYAKRIGF